MKKFPPGPRSWIPGRVFRRLRRDPLQFLTDMGKQYGDIWSFSAFGVPYVVMNHPDLVKEVLLTQADAFWKGPALQNSKGFLGEGLLTAEGETHKRQRRLMTPAFHAKMVENYAGIVRECTTLLCDNWQSQPSKSPATDTAIRPDLMRLTLVIAGRALLGTMLDEETELVYHSMETLISGFRRAVVPWGKWLSKLPLKSTRELEQARDGLRQLIRRTIAARRAEPDTTRRSDLLSVLIRATDEEGDGVRLTDQQLVDQAVTILTAGHETTANAMTFTLWLLAKHPEEQQKLHNEILAAAPNGDIGPDIMDKAPRIRWVLSESMRILPPVWTVGRQNQREVTLNGFRLPPRCTVLVPQWVLHRDRRWWGEDARDFRAERWRQPAHQRYAYFPFATGPRNCIGEAFAWLEMAIALAMLVREFEFALPEETPDPITLMPSITLRPRCILKLKILKRTQPGN